MCDLQSTCVPCHYEKEPLAISMLWRAYQTEFRKDMRVTVQLVLGQVWIFENSSPNISEAFFPLPIAENFHNRLVQASDIDFANLSTFTLTFRP